MYALTVLALVVAVPLAVVAWRMAATLPLHIRGTNNLTPDDKAALVELLSHTIRADPLSPRVVRWRAILDKLQPPAREPASRITEVEVSCGEKSSSEDIERLHKELAEAIRIGDDEGMRRAYQQLLRAGQPRKQIMDKVIHLATSSHSAPQPAPVKPIGPVPAMEETGIAAQTAKGRGDPWSDDPDQPVKLSEEERERFRKGVGVLLKKLRGRKARARNVPDSSAESAPASSMLEVGSLPVTGVPEERIKEELPSDAPSDLGSVRTGGRVIG
jgi:hypothetical protein